MTNTRVFRFALFTAVTSFGACAEAPSAKVGTPEMRAALFDTIMARTERREAWSPIKNANLGFDPVQAMLAVKDEVVSAETEEDRRKIGVHGARLLDLDQRFFGFGAENKDVGVKSVELGV